MKLRASVWPAAWRSVAEPDAPPVTRPGRGISTFQTIAFLAAHAPLALVMDRVPAVATVHAMAIFAIGAWWAVAGGRLDRVAMVAGYIAGADVLWRMTDAQVYWEFGKYAASAIFLLALLRERRLKPPFLAFLYFALLLPSAVLTFVNEDWEMARNQVSFNLSGPFALMMCAWFFAKVRLSMTELRWVFIALIGPAIGVATIAASGTFAGSDVVFSDASNYVTSGGFGPNQVSAILGLGALVALFVAMDTGASRILRWAITAVLVGLAVQSALTFSRGGLYTAAGGTAVAACFAMKDSRLRARLLPLVLVLLAIGNYFVVPYLDAFTEGQIGVRFQDTYLTGRDRMIQADIEVWRNNPIFGVGPGEARTYRAALSSLAPSRSAPRNMAAHTEFSRLLSEHGLFGLGALLLYIASGLFNVMKADSPRTRAIVAGLSCWSALFTLSAAMRVLAPSLAFGIGFATLFDDTADANAPAGAAVGVRHGRSVRPLVQGHPALTNRRSPANIG